MCCSMQSQVHKVMRLWGDVFVLSCVLKQIQSEGDIGTDDVESYWKLLQKKNYDFIP